MMNWQSHYGFSRMIKPNHLTIGLNMPIENHGKEKPTLDHQIERVQLAEKLGFSSIWFQDVLLEDPTFDDPATGQILDSFIYLTYMGAHTKRINLGTAASVLSLRHPARFAKEIASIENLIPERLMIGLSSGDRRRDFEAMNVPIMERGHLFRESFDYLQHLLYTDYSNTETALGKMENVTLVPKPTSKIPMFITGYAQQTLEYVAKHGDGWMFYPQSVDEQKGLIQQFRQEVARFEAETFKPFFQPVVFDLAENKDQEPERISLGYRVGSRALVKWLKEYEAIGVNHVLVSLGDSTRPAEEVMRELGEEVIPYFPPHHDYK
nr:TIGR03571 family LLM class oxidoreductase [Pontibacillus salipaludis]